MNVIFQYILDICDDTISIKPILYLMQKHRSTWYRKTHIIHTSCDIFCIDDGIENTPTKSNIQEITIAIEKIF